MTKKQEDVLKFIKKFHVEHDYPPTIREIGEHFKVTIGTVQGHLDRLRAQGYLTWAKGQPRTFKVRGGA